MNFKRNCISIISLLAGVMLITACGKDTSFKRYEFIKETSDITEDFVSEDGSYKKYANYADFVAKNVGGTNITFEGSATDVMRNKCGKKIMDSTGDQKLLIIPVDFKDFKCDDLGLSKERFISDVSKAFFGVSKNNSYVSVSQYFNISSYGKLRISGEVIDDFFTINKTISEIRRNEKSEKEAIKDLYNDLIDFAIEQGIDLETYVIPGLEGDYKEKKNIPMYLVYTQPNDTELTEDSYFWAYTMTDSVPVSWSSYSFMYTQLGEPDAHTYIHEVGHLLGLNDYYPTNKKLTTTTVGYEPTARIDMMDCSIGDETAFSKMFLNWVKPYHVLNSTEITIKPLVDSGDLILISNRWNKSVFDEYYLLEFYTPTGLNNYDTRVGNSEAKLPALPGIKLYHVDARLGYFAVRDQFVGYCDVTGPNSLIDTVDLAHDNCTYSSSSENFKNYLYELKLNNPDLLKTGCATDANLYHSGDKISLPTTNRGGALNFTITVSSITYKNAVIKIENTLN